MYVCPIRSGTRISSDIRATFSKGESRRYAAYSATVCTLPAAACSRDLIIPRCAARYRNHRTNTEYPNSLVRRIIISTRRQENKITLLDRIG